MSTETETATIEEVPERGPVITPEDKEKFFKAVLSDTAFDDTISLMDDQLKVTFRTLTVEENSDIIQQISNDKTNGLAENNDAYFITVTTYRLALALMAIDGKEYSAVTKKNHTEKDGVTYVRERSLKMRSWGTFKLSAFINSFNDFEAKINKLTTAVQTPNFWKASA